MRDAQPFVAKPLYGIRVDQVIMGLCDFIFMLIVWFQSEIDLERIYSFIQLFFFLNSPTVSLIFRQTDDLPTAAENLSNDR